MYRGKNFLAMLTMTCVWLVMSAPLTINATENATQSINVDQFVKMRQLQNQQTEMNSLRQTARTEKPIPQQLQVMERATVQKQFSAVKSNRLGNQFESRIRVHRSGPTFSGSAATVGHSANREVIGGSGQMSLADPNLHYFNFSTGMNGADTAGMDVNITGNEGVNFGNEGWNGQPGFSYPSMLFFLLAQGSLNDIVLVPAVTDSGLIWTDISWDWNGGGNNGQPLAVGNIWVVYTRTTHCYAVLEVTDVTADSFSFDYLYQNDGSNVFGEMLPMTMTVNGGSSDNLEVGSNPYFEFTTPYPGQSVVTIMWDRDHNGLPSEGDIPVNEWVATDGDMHDENPDVGVFGFTFTDEMADGLNNVASDFVFLAQNGPQFASVPVSFYQIETNFVISGTVTEAATGNPIEGIVVWAAMGGNNNNNNGPDFITLTDIDGNYNLFVPDTGFYVLGSFDHLGVTDGLFPSPMHYDFTLLSPIIDADFEYIVPSSSIYGYVTDNSGMPAIGVGVYASGSDFDVMSYTNGNGYYEIGVNPGHFWVGVDGQTAMGEFLIPQDQEVWVEDFLFQHDITLFRPNASISGSLILDGQPWPNMMVFAAHDMYGAGVSFTDTSGNFSIPVYAPVPYGYYLDINPNGPMDNLVKLSDNNNVMPGAVNQIIEYQSVAGGLEGFVYNTDTGEVIYDEVGVFARNLATGQEFSSGPWFGDGMYRLFLPDGMYEVAAGGRNFQPVPFDTVMINGEMIPYDFYLTPFSYAGAVEGFVYNANNMTPIPNADVWIGGEVWGNWMMTDENGFYHFDTPNGMFFIGSSAPDYQSEWDSVWVDNNVVSHDFYLTPFDIGGSLSGTTYGRDSNGNIMPLPWTNISINSWEYSFYIQSDDQGYYYINLPAGVYQVEAYHDGYFPTYNDSIFVNGNMTLDLYLDPFVVDGAVFGHVFDAETQMPIPDAEVILFMPESPIGYQTWTNGNGDYWFDVQNGFYWLMVNSPNYQPYMNQLVTVTDDSVQIDVAMLPYDGSIYGTVRDQNTNLPLSDAWVYIQSRTDSMMNFYINTDWDGNYHVGLPNGTYDVTAGRWDFDAFTQFDIQVADNDVQVDFYLNYHTWATPPAIRWIRDVPDDQGRWVRLRFWANGTDWGPYQGFSVWRSREISIGTVWEFVDYIPFHDQDAYSLVVPTLVDSNAVTGPTGDFWSTFIVTGHADMWNFFDSEPGSGYSIDNIIPGVPQNLTVTGSSPSGVNIEWDASMDDDFQYFEVYRTESGDFSGVSPELQIETGFFDESVQIGHTYYYMVKSVDANGNHSDASNTVNTMIVSIGAEGIIPAEFSLGQNYPNPFNPSTQIRFGLPEASEVTLTIYNIRGQVVRTLVNGNMSAGYLTATWDGKDNQGSLVSSGTYLYRITAGKFVQTHKMVLMR